MILIVLFSVPGRILPNIFNVSWYIFLHAATLTPLLTLNATLSRSLPIWASGNSNQCLCPRRNPR